MDATQCLKDMLQIAARIQRHRDKDPSDVNTALVLQDDADALAERIHALNTWVCSGGSLPEQWARKLPTDSETCGFHGKASSNSCLECAYLLLLREKQKDRGPNMATEYDGTDYG